MSGWFYQLSYRIKQKAHESIDSAKERLIGVAADHRQPLLFPEVRILRLEQNSTAAIRSVAKPVAWRASAGKNLSKIT
jgi:hypothetical protein